MRAIRTNLLRMEFSTQHYLYEIEVISQSHSLKEIMPEIDAQLSQIFPFALISYPLLYTRQSLDKTILYTHLSDGSAVQLRLTQCPVNQSQSIVTIIANLIARKLLLLTQLLYSPIFEACFNPFEQVVQNGQRMIPGSRLGVQMSQAGCMLSIQSIRLTLSDAGSLGQQSEVLLDYDCGKFFLKQNIVRIDKEKGQVIFRNNATSRRQALYSATITPLNGYPLALNIQNMIDRIKYTSQQFCSKWELKFDTRLVEVQGTYPNAGVLGFRENLDKGLAQLISPMNFPNYLNNYLNYFNSVKFDDMLRASVVYLVDSEKEERMQFVGSFRREIQKVGARMDLQLISKTVTYSDYSHLQELLNLMANQPCEHIRIFIVFHNKQKQKVQLQPFQKAIQFMINNLIPFHLVEIDANKQHHFDALAYHHLSTIYTKSRVNPWKLKNIPFMNQPMMVVALHIEQTKQKVYSVSLVATMNLFFTKFTAVHKITGKDTISQSIEKGLLECIETFKSKHQRYPNRVFLFRTGADAEEEVDLQRAKNEVRLRGGELTYITLYNQHRIRIFNQTDNNYISSDTVKKVQLFLYTNINKQLYYQIELETPPYRVKISPPLQNDPNFVPKVLELISRVVMGGVGHNYGKGLGILDYPKKLNKFKQYNLSSWQSSLLDGILYFL